MTPGSGARGGRRDESRRPAGAAFAAGGLPLEDIESIRNHIRFVKADARPEDAARFEEQVRALQGSWREQSEADPARFRTGEDLRISLVEAIHAAARTTGPGRE